MRKRPFLLIVPLLAIFAAVVHADAPATRPTTQPAGLSEDQMLQVVKQHFRQTLTIAVVHPVASWRNECIERRDVPSPLPDYRFFFAAVHHPPLAQGTEEMVAVSRSGVVLPKFDGQQFGELVRNADTSGWKVQDYLNAASLYVHLSVSSSQDGWIVLDGPGEWTALKDVEPTSPERWNEWKEVSKKIKPPSVQIPKGQGRVVVTFYEWHYIGGQLRKWTFTFQDGLTAEFESLGTFGGAMEL